MVDLSGLFHKAKSKAQEAAQRSPNSVRKGVDKAQSMLDQRTGGKYSEAIEKGGDVVERALGVPGQARDAYQDERAAPTTRPDPVRAEPIEPPERIDPPEKI